MKKILILGGGFGGVRAALDLEKKLGKDFDITLVNDSHYHCYIPDLYETATALLKDDRRKDYRYLMASVDIHLDQIFKDKRVALKIGKVLGIDLKKREVVLEDSKLDYDYLVVALGSTSSYFGIPGAEDYSHPLKNVEDALNIRDDLYELVERSKGEGKKFNVVIAGGGFTGVELSGAMGNLIKGRGQITVIEATDKVLGGMPAWAQKDSFQLLKNLGVEIKLNSPIKEVRKDKILLEKEEIGFDYLIWAAGVKANKLEKGVVGLELNKKDQLTAGKDLSLPDYPEVFAIGDNAEIDGAPPAAWAAIDEAKLAADNLYSRVNNLPAKKYLPPKPQFVVPIGERYALTNAFGWRIKGVVAWLIKQFIALRYLVSILTLSVALRVFEKEVEVDVLDH